MRRDTERGKRRASVASAAVIILLLGVFLAAVFLPLLREVWGETPAVGVLLIYAAAIVVVIAGVLAALRLRLKEIEGGEEEDAGKY